jgi:RNA polymerase sigma factor (sigma-70 family)
LEEANVLGLLLVMVKHKAFNYIKAQQRVTSLDSENVTFIFEPHVPPFDYPEHAAIRGDVSLALYQAVNALSKPQRDVIALRYFYGCNLEEIASILQMPLSTVKSHLRRGQRRLRVLLIAYDVSSDDIGFWDKTQESFPKAILRE